MKNLLGILRGNALFFGDLSGSHRARVTLVGTFAASKENAAKNGVFSPAGDSHAGEYACAA
jgi:hypothetical protein